MFSLLATCYSSRNLNSERNYATSKCIMKYAFIMDAMAGLAMIGIGVSALKGNIMLAPESAKALIIVGVFYNVLAFCAKATNTIVTTKFEPRDEDIECCIGALILQAFLCRTCS